jgi:hypothetical protein
MWDQAEAPRCDCNFFDFLPLCPVAPHPHPSLLRPDPSETVYTQCLSRYLFLESQPTHALRTLAWALLRDLQGGPGAAPHHLPPPPNSTVALMASPFGTLGNKLPDRVMPVTQRTLQITTEMQVVALGKEPISLSQRPPVSSQSLAQHKPKNNTHDSKLAGDPSSLCDLLCSRQICHCNTYHTLCTPGLPHPEPQGQEGSPRPQARI